MDRFLLDMKTMKILNEREFFNLLTDNKIVITQTGAIFPDDNKTFYVIESLDDVLEKHDNY